MTLTNEMINTAKTILNRYEGQNITETMANEIKREVNANRVEVDDYFNEAYIVFDGWVAKITDTEVFGEEVKRVTILDIEDEEVDEIYAEERE